MAVYKVIQDVEAEDKFLGPLTFKQFLFGGGAVISGYLIFLVVSTGVGFLAVIFLPFFAGFVALAIPWTKDQPTELFLASRIRFLFMKRKRIWDQSGVKDLVTITVPKKEVHIYSDGLNQDEVRSRFSALSSVIDTRGWAVKNMDHAPASDRLVAPTAPTIYPEQVDAQRTKDMLDERSTQSSGIDGAIHKSEDEHRKHTLDLVAEAREKSKQLNKSVLNEDKPQSAPQPQFQSQPPQPKPDPVLDSVSLPMVDEKFTSMQTSQPSFSTLSPQPIASRPITLPSIAPDEEQALLDKLHKKEAVLKDIESHSRLKTIFPVGQQPQPQPPTQTQAQTNASATPVDPAILSLAQNDDRSIESLAREANKKGELFDDEVVVSLH